MTWSRRLINPMLKIPMIRGSQPHSAAVRQREASLAYDCMDRLNEIQVPALILHGKKDKIAPYRLAEEMHSGIIDSKMITFHSGHLFLILRPRKFIDATLDFLGSIKT
jgi:pimeloyl-ACP methyl ester carboxylesterase